MNCHLNLKPQVCKHGGISVIGVHSKKKTGSECTAEELPLICDLTYTNSDSELKEYAKKWQNIVYRNMPKNGKIWCIVTLQSGLTI